MIRRERTCDACSGRGWVMKYATSDACAATWPDFCPKCGGRSKFRTVQLARFLEVNRRDVYRVDTLIAGTRVGVRVLDAIVRKFPELFAA